MLLFCLSSIIIFKLTIVLANEQKSAEVSSKYTPILYKRYYLFHYFSLIKSLEDCVYFFTCILPDYMAHVIPKEF